MTILHVSSADKRQEFTLVQDSFTGLLTRNFCKRSFIPQAMTHADLRPLRRSIGIARFHFILVFAFMFRALWSYGSVSAGREKWANFVLQKYFLALHCDQTVPPIQLFLTVLRRFCPWYSKYIFKKINFFCFRYFDRYHPQSAVLAHFEVGLQPSCN